MKLINGDCIEEMKKLDAGSIDMILTDPPYGTTVCKWDTIIPLDAMWEQINRVIKPKGAIVMTASQPFTSILTVSNIKNFKHEWIWKKNKGSNFASLKTNPFKEHESVLVFCYKTVNYYPIMQERSDLGKARAKYDFQSSGGGEAVGILKGNGERINRDKNKRNPSSVQSFNTEVGFHPTQKPVPLMEYLIKTYTNEGETVLDFTMGSGTTGVACKKTNRDFIGIELDKEYFEVAKQRIEDVPTNMGDLL